MVADIPHSEDHLRRGSSAHSKKRDIVIRALNSDHVLDAKKIVDLFLANYGPSYPFEPVYDPNFWGLKDLDEDLEEPHMTSMVAVDGGRFVAHMGLQFLPLTRAQVVFENRTSPCVLELLLPAIHPAYRKQVFSLSRLFWKCLTNLAKRQRWHLMYHYSFLSHPVSQLIAVKCFQSLEMALLPNNVPQQKYDMVGMANPESRTSALLMYNKFGEEVSTPLDLFTPAAHREFIEELYSPLKLQRQFHDACAESLPPWEDNKQDAPIPYCVDSVRHNEFGMCKLQITPSHIHSIDSLFELIQAVSNGERRRLTLYVALNDPFCPQFCDALENRGYRFCGVMPSSDENDYVIYAPYTDAEVLELSVYSERAKWLKQYLLRSSRKQSAVDSSYSLGTQTSLFDSAAVNV